MSVDKTRAAKLWKTEVEEEDGLKDPVEWNPVEDGSGPELDHREASVDNPVGQVLGVIVSGSGLKSLQREIAWNHQGSKVGQQLANAIYTG